MFVTHCLGIHPQVLRERLTVGWRSCRDVCSLVVLIRSKGLIRLSVGCSIRFALPHIFHESLSITDHKTLAAQSTHSLGFSVRGDNHLHGERAGQEDSELQL